MANSAAVRSLSSLLPATSRRLCTSSVSTVSSPENARRKPAWRLFRALCAPNGNRGKSVEETMNWWLNEQGMKVNQWEIKLFVQNMRRDKRYECALNLMRWAEKRGTVEPSSFQGFSAIHLDLISKVEGINSAESYFGNLSETAKNKDVYGALLNNYCQEKLEDKATALYQKMNELNFTSSVDVHNYLMTLYKKLDEHMKVLDIYHKMKGNCIRPDSHTYHMVITSLCLLKDLDAINAIFEELKEESNIGWLVYRKLASHYFSIGSFEKAETCLKKIEELMGIQNREALNYLISMYANMGNTVGVNHTWDSLKTSFRRVTYIDYLIMVESLDKLGDLGPLELCFKECEQRFATYDTKMANIMIVAYLRNDMIDEARNIFKKGFQNGKLNFKSYEIWISYYLEKCKMDLAFKFLQDNADYLKDQEWKPNKEMVDSFLKHFDEVNDITSARSFHEIMKKLGYSDILVCE